MIDWIDSVGPAISRIRPRLRIAGILRSSLDAPLKIYTRSWIMVLGKARFVSANPRVIRGTSPAPTSSLSAFDNGPYDSL